LKSPNLKQHEWFAPLFEKLQLEWARFNGLPLVQLNMESMESPSNISFRSAKVEEPKTTIQARRFSAP
jgi:hypothetical protein